MRVSSSHFWRCSYGDWDSLGTHWKTSSVWCYVCCHYSFPNAQTRLMESSSSKDRRKKIEKTHIYMNTVTDELVLTATQSVAQKGHRESEGSLNRSNFLAMLQEIAQYDLQIQKHMNESGNAKIHKLGHSKWKSWLFGLNGRLRHEQRSERKSGVHGDKINDLSKNISCLLLLDITTMKVLIRVLKTSKQADHLDAAALTNMIIPGLEKYRLEYRIHQAEQWLRWINRNLRWCIFAIFQQLQEFISNSYSHQKWVEV